MFKILLLLVLSLNILPVQARAQPGAGQAAGNDTAPSQSTPSVLVEQHDSTKLQGESANNIKAQVRVISSSGKDGYDKAAFWINSGLALVGFAGIGVAICTLRKIKTQSEEMRLQRVAMQDTLNVIKRQANAMDDQNRAMIAKERARIALKVEKLHLTDQHAFLWNLETPFNISNSGTSRT